jgi:hypothetical protein
MKKIQTFLALAIALMGTAQETMAQSSDARYPMGVWQTNGSDESANQSIYFVNMEIFRENEYDGGYNGQKGCGTFDITAADSDKEYYSGVLTYAGKEMKDGVPTGTYYFYVTSKQGKSCTIDVNASRSPMIIATGELKDHPALKDPIILIPGALSGTGGETHAMYCETEKDLLDDLRFAVKDRRTKTPGFGNLQQYINAHAKLLPNKSKYAKTKGTGTINIRSSRSATATKVGELKPDQTLLVIDEFDGWCQVQLDENKNGWVSLSVVTLTNTQGKTTFSTGITAKAAATGSAAAETTCPLVGDWYGILNDGWGETTVFLQADKKVGVNSKMSKRQSNGAIDMTDDAFIREWNSNLVFNRTVSDNVYEFTVQRMVGKQLKSGKLQIRRNGDKITMTGMDAWTKQQPFHGKTIGKPNPTYN